MNRYPNRQTTMAASVDAGRLETPFTAGFRAGMSACTVIGRKLGSMYRVPSDCPDRMEKLIRDLDETAVRSS